MGSTIERPSVGKILSDSWWIGSSFGILVGIRYFFATLIRKFRRPALETKVPIRRFEDLSDQEANEVALAYGLMADSRESLNRQWHEIQKHVN